MLKRDLENLFSSCYKVNYRKKNILAIFRKIFKKIEIISDAIIPIAAISINFYTIFCVTLQSMTVPNCMSKAFSYQDLRRGRLCTPIPRGMVRQKYPRANRVKIYIFLELKDMHNKSHNSSQI